MLPRYMESTLFLPLGLQNNPQLHRQSEAGIHMVAKGNPYNLVKTDRKIGAVLEIRQPFWKWEEAAMESGIKNKVQVT